MRCGSCRALGRIKLVIPSFMRNTLLLRLRGRGHMLRHLAACAALALVTGPAAAQDIKAGVLTCDVSAGLGFIIGSKKQIACTFAPEGPGRREDYDGTITKFGLDLGVTTGGVMVWAVFTRSVAG